MTMRDLCREKCRGIRQDNLSWISLDHGDRQTRCDHALATTFTQRDEAALNFRQHETSSLASGRSYEMHIGTDVL